MKVSLQKHIQIHAYRACAEDSYHHAKDILVFTGPKRAIVDNVDPTHWKLTDGIRKWTTIK